MTDPARTPDQLAELADRYLDGDLSRDEALAFERDLAARPELAEALSAALALRELLVVLPPVAPPAGLAARIADALPLRKERRARGAEDEREGSPVQAVLSAFTWGLRGPAVAAMGAAAPAASATNGVSALRWALGPLGAPGEPAPPRPRRPLWRRIVFGRAK
jgi:anti-sigma factor RsiW